MRKLFIIYVLFFTIVFYNEQANSYAFSLVPAVVRIALTASTAKKIAYPLAAAVGVYEGQKMYNIWSVITQSSDVPVFKQEFNSDGFAAAPYPDFRTSENSDKVYYLTANPTAGTIKLTTGGFMYGLKLSAGSAKYICNTPVSSKTSSCGDNCEITYYDYQVCKLAETTAQPDTDVITAEVKPASEVVDESGNPLINLDLLEDLAVKWDESLAKQAQRLSEALSTMTGSVVDAIKNARPNGLTIEDIAGLIDAAPPAYDPYKDIPITGPVPPIDVPADPDDPTIPDDPTLPIDPPVITPPVTPTVPLLPDGSVPVTTQNPPNINVTVDMPEEIAIKDVSVPALPFFDVPALPEFDTAVDMPDEKDWLKPVRDFVSNIMSSLPFLSMFESASINGSGSSSVSFDVLNHTFYFDFSDYESFFSYLGTVLIFISSIKAVFIVVRGD